MNHSRQRANAVQPEFIEVGQFVLISRVHPSRSAWFWMGRQKPFQVAAEQQRLTLSAVRRLGNLIRSRQARFVFAHVPIKTTRFTARSILRMFHGDFGGLAYYRIASQVGCPLVGLDFNDETPLSTMALKILDRSICYFKRELSIDLSKLLPIGAKPQHRMLLERNAHKLLPISLGLCEDRLRNLPSAIPSKNSDVFYSGSLSSAVRCGDLALLDQLEKMHVRVDQPQQRLSQSEFLHRCGQSYLVWSPEGLGWDCFRHYEAAGAGSVPVMNSPWIRQHQPLLHGRHALYYESPWSSGGVGKGIARDPNLGLIETVRLALQNKPRLVEMGNAARMHVLQHHLHRQIVDHMIDRAHQLHQSAASIRRAA